MVMKNPVRQFYAQFGSSLPLPTAVSAAGIGMRPKSAGGATTEASKEIAIRIAYWASVTTKKNVTSARELAFIYRNCTTGKVISAKLGTTRLAAGSAAGQN